MLSRRRIAITVSTLCLAFGASLLAALPASAFLYSPGGPPDTLLPRDTILSGQALVSHNGEFQLEMRADGNLVETGLGQTFFATHTQGHPGAYLVNQGDGNLVLRSAAGKALWASNQRFTGDSLLRIYDTGALIQFDAHAGSHWRVDAPDVTVLPPGQRLTSLGTRSYASQSLQTFSTNNLLLTLTLQADGNLVSSVVGQPRWSTGTAGNPGAVALMQADGNFVVYSGTGRPLWFTGTSGNPGARLVLQRSDDNLVVYSRAGKPLWSIQTGRIG